MFNSTADGCSPGIPSWQYHRLWSLWDMIKFSTSPFVHLAADLGRIVEAGKDFKDDELRHEAGRKIDKEALLTYRTDMEQLGLRMTLIHLDRMVKAFESPITIGNVRTMQVELLNRMRDESGLMFMVCLRDADVAFYEPDAPLFGSEVEDKVPSVIEDIAEAGKCLGLQRPTASVFHLMRVMEVGVQKLGDKLAIPDTQEKVWQVVLDGINSRIKGLGKTDEAKQYASISAHLYNVKLAWRNEVMHPKATYTPEEAENVFRAVKAFMKDLVTVL